MEAIQRLERLATEFAKLGSVNEVFGSECGQIVMRKKLEMEEAKAQHLQQLTANRLKCAAVSGETAQTESLISEIRRAEAADVSSAAQIAAAAEALDAKRAALEDEARALDNNVRILKHDLDQRTAILNEKVDQRKAAAQKALMEMRFFEDKLGLRIVSVATNVLRFIFTNISSKNWAEEFSFVLDVSATTYKLMDCSPAESIPNCDAMLNFLNESRDFYRFLKEMRQGFHDYCMKRDSK
ncbi:hypothetical protein BCR33DRAFT_713223 [Rhizoclosmatium globosum]|uniref:Kinetochore protein SPC25 n=1 Tax=Rhizoclosmatium globosum TaxID=329046 RepID=A0A1Y2CTR0_9FUNG|nr:hypothetical protein BCR33DRAFT_713223 [Rhizoclosmatium globosum]|eukprot:ORY50413.1 hypothetical protein BCR33DRAFT_713223 [Rhizoclosmatium globosum]